MSTAITYNERDLVTMLKQREETAFSYLYDHYSGSLYAVILNIVPDRELANDQLQEVFIKIWKQIDSYDQNKGRLFTWMLNIARNQAIDKTRSKEMSKGKKTDDIDNLVNRIDSQESGELAVDAIGLTEVLERLPKDQKFVVEYLYLKGYTQSELAEEFDIPLGTVKTRLRLAMIELRSILEVT